MGVVVVVAGSVAGLLRGNRNEGRGQRPAARCDRDSDPTPCPPVHGGGCRLGLACAMIRMRSLYVSAMSMQVDWGEWIFRDGSRACA